VYFHAFHIEGFGLYHDLRVGDLPRLGVFTGANESGKTTLLEFFRFLLFGDRPGSAGAALYPPLAGGRRGGRLTLVNAAGERLDVQRLGAGRSASLELFDASGAALGDPQACLAALLGGLDREAYERLFALGAGELQGLGLLDDRKLVRQLAAAAAGTPALPAALARLDREIGGLLKGERARTPRINAALSARDEALARLRASGQLADRFVARRYRLDERRQAAAAQAEALEAERHELEVLARAQPLFDRVAELHAALGAPELQPRPVPRGTWLAVLGGGVGVSLLLLGLSARAWPAVAGILASLATVALLAWRRGRAEARRAQARSPLERNLEATRRELRGRAGTTDPAEFAGESANRRARIRTLAEAERTVQREIGSLELEVASLGHDTAVETALAERAAASSELDSALEAWARRALCRELLDHARAHHEAERRPRVLAAAERYLALMLGTEAGETALVGAEQLTLRDDDHGLRREGQWSTGLADQIYLAVRLAFAQELAGPGGQGPPVVLDDVHLRFDPARRRGLARALAVFTRPGRQVLVFSGQPELAADVAAEFREGVGLFELSGGQITRVG
jgi:uncharacterized protein YhaN